jgi:short-subunit dehydrogenase
MTDLIIDRTFVITGAAQGIGRALARLLSSKGAHVALVDIDLPRLEELKIELSERGTRCSIHGLDLVQEGASETIRAQVLAFHGAVDGLINNAGATIIGPFSATAAHDFEWLMALNFMAPVRLTRALLPELMTGKDPVIVNLSSVFGLIAPLGQSTYAASKFALRGFSEALMHELADSPVRVVTVHPGGVSTGIVRHARMPASAEGMRADIDRRFAKASKTTAEQAAGRIVWAIEKRKKRLLIGADARLIDILQRLMPVRHWDLLGPLLRPR